MRNPCGTMSKRSSSYWYESLGFVKTSCLVRSYDNHVNRSVHVNFQQLAFQWRGEALICAISPFPRCKYSHHGQFQAINMKTQSSLTSREKQTPAHHCIQMYCENTVCKIQS